MQRSLILALLCLGGAARADDAPAAKPAGFVAGEAFTYKFSVGIIDAGRARMSVGYPEERAGGRLLAVQGDAHASPWIAIFARLDDTYKVVIDADALLPRKVSADETGIRIRHIESEFEGARARVHLIAPGRDVDQRRAFPGPTRDPVAALFALRAARLADGDRLEQLVIDGLALYRATFVAVGRERIERSSGERVVAIHVTVDATRIDDLGRPDPAHKPRQMHIYLSDDERRIPLRMAGSTDIGEARLDLTSYIPGGAASAAEPSARSGPSGGR